MCDRANCDLCLWLDNLEVRDVTWCECGLREVGEGLTTCVMCASEKPNP